MGTSHFAAPLVGDDDGAQVVNASWPNEAAESTVSTQAAELLSSIQRLPRKDVCRCSFFWTLCTGSWWLQ